MSDQETPVTTTDDGGAATTRIRQLVARVKELEAKVGELAPQAEAATKYATQLDEMKAMSKAEREALRVEREIMAAGILDAEGLEYVQHAYSKLSSEGRPPLAEWLGNRDALPKAVRAYLADAPAAPATPAAAPVAPASPAAPAPKSSTAAVAQVPSEPQAWTQQSISRLSPPEFKANYDAIMASLRTG
jgi:outer membrane murein-binding lipoprotein Lpp